MASNFTVNQHDLTYILKQIKIAELHAQTPGMTVTEAIMQVYGVSAADAALLPAGLRTVDGTFNNLLPGQSDFGAAGGTFPRLLDPVYTNGSGGSFDSNGLAPGGIVTNADYTPTANGTNMSVVDSDPRTISNLIVEQSVSNPAAIYAALKVAGIEGSAAVSAVAAISSAYQATLHANGANAAVSAAQTILTAAIGQLGVASTAASGAQTVRDTYAAAAPLTGPAQDASEIAQSAINALIDELNTPTGNEGVLYDAAIDAAVAAVIAATAVQTALGAVTSAEASATATGAQVLLNALTALNDDSLIDANDIVAASDAAAAYLVISGPSGTAEQSITVIDAALVDADAALVTANAVVATATTAQEQAQITLDAAVAVADSAGTPAQTQAALAAAIEAYDLHTDASGGLIIEALSPDIGLSPAFNNVMTIFGQFFDHGLDLVNKGGNGTVYIPLQADDPLIAGQDQVFGTADDLPAYLRFMTLTRATQTIDANGVAQHTNVTTPFVDQNQTYTSHASHQVFLREYVRVGGETLSTGKLLDGQTNGVPDGTIATWADVKASALEFLGIQLTDMDVGRVPLLLTDAYGNLILGENGYAQMVMAPDTAHANSWLMEGTATGISTAGSEESGVAFLVDIAHNAAPDGLPADADSDSGNAVGRNPFTGQRTEYDNELLDAHFLTGDGRGNENIGLTAVHATFHAEHNRMVTANMATILESGDIAFINEWLLTDIAAIPADTSTLQWDGERLFQAARFVTEMQYQHLVFEEFGRRIQPAIDPFVFTNTAEIDASILAEFAHTVYRFGHSMLTDTVDRLTNDLTTVNGDAEQISLIDAFLNPNEYVATGVDFDAIQGALFRGMSRDQGSEIDEFIVPALRSNLLGLPLDLAALNIARGRDTGIPSLNETRAQLYNDFGLADLRPYDSWSDFAQHMRNPVSLVNFIAAYGNHAALEAATTLDAMREAATLLIFGDGNNSDGVTIHGVTYTNADRLAFLNGTGQYGAGAGARGGLDRVDLWIGGLAEQINEFGGMLGSTFNFVFEYQMQQLQNGDRFYYLSRTQGLNLLNQLEQNTFSDIVARNSDLSDEHSTHLNALLFVTPDMIFELDRGIAQEDYNLADPGSLDPEFEGILQVLTPKVVRDYSASTEVAGHDVGGEFHFLGGEHVVVGGTEGNDIITTDKGIDAIYGDGGDDYLNAGMESDEVFGGDGDDIIEDPFGDDFLRGGNGNDVIAAARGADLLFGGAGVDALILGQDAAEIFGGEGNDFLLGSDGGDALLGNEGDDWIEGGEGFDTISGENSELFFNSTIIGHDIAWGQGNDQDYDLESGDDIAFTGAGIQRFEGMFGFDWAITKYDISVIDLDLAVPIFTTVPANILRDRFDLMEAASGWSNADILRGDSRGSVVLAAAVETDFADHILTAEGIARIDGMAEWLDGALETLFGPGATEFRNGNILLGGGGSDVIQGRGGFDIIDGDAWLNVRIRVMVDGVEYSAESLSSNRVVAGEFAGRLYHVDANGNPDFTNVGFGGRSLTSLLLDRTVNPGDMTAVREILMDDGIGDSDRAMFFGTAAEYDIEGAGEVVDGYIQVAYDMNGDGFISVTDRDNGTTGAVVNGTTLASRRSLIDDTDLLRNIELLQFSDVTLDLANVILAGEPATDIVLAAALPVGVNLPAVGAQIATLTPDLGNAVLSLQAGSSASFALSGTGALTVGAQLAQGVTHVLNVAATNPAGVYLETMWVHAGTTGNNVINGFAGTDVVYAMNGADLVNGGDGDDALFGQSGNDNLHGDAGDDLIMGGAGADAVSGDDGNDRIVWQFGDGIDDTDGGADTDRMEIVGTAANEVITVNFNGTVITSILQAGNIQNIEEITLDLRGSADQLSYVTTTTQGVSVDLGAGTASGFVSIANVANVTGTNYADTLIGNSGANRLLGRGGNDLFIALADDAQDEFDGSSGIDTVDYSSYTTALSINLSQPQPVVAFGTGVANDILRGIENLIGGSDGDYLRGNNSVNVLTGGLGSDTLDGAGLNDLLYGGGGDDIIIGGTGLDSMTGGFGDDTFVFSARADSGVGAASDRILDFQGAGVAGGDLIDLSDIAPGLVFIGNANFVGGASNQVRVVISGADTLIQIDVDADIGVESQIRLIGQHALTADDFIL